MKQKLKDTMQSIEFGLWEIWFKIQPILGADFQFTTLEELHYLLVNRQIRIDSKPNSYTIVIHNNHIKIINIEKLYISSWPVKEFYYVSYITYPEILSAGDFQFLDEFSSFLYKLAAWCKMKSTRLTSNEVSELNRELTKLQEDNGNFIQNIDKIYDVLNRIDNLPNMSEKVRIYDQYIKLSRDIEMKEEEIRSKLEICHEIYDYWHPKMNSIKELNENLTNIRDNIGIMEDLDGALDRSVSISQSMTEMSKSVQNLEKNEDKLRSLDELVKEINTLMGKYNDVRDLFKELGQYCPICLDNTPDSITNCCEQRICQSCILIWKSKNNTCPLCRTENVKINSTDKV